jgi:hypothetical protein
MLKAMSPSPEQKQLFASLCPASNTVFVNERVSFQTEDQQRVILVHRVVFSITAWKIVRPKPML